MKSFLESLGEAEARLDAVIREYAFVVIADKIRRTNSASDQARKTLDRYLAKIAAPLLAPAVETGTAVTDLQTP